MRIPRIYYPEELKPNSLKGTYVKSISISSTMSSSVKIDLNKLI